MKKKEIIKKNRGWGFKPHICLKQIKKEVTNEKTEPIKKRR